MVDGDGQRAAAGRGRRNRHPRAERDEGLLEQARGHRQGRSLDGWFYTGDAGYFDEDGYLYIHDRVKDMIVSGGENIYPAEVENALFGHPGRRRRGRDRRARRALGRGGEGDRRAKAGCEATAADIIALARDRIAGYKLPKSVDFIDALPRNPSGQNPQARIARTLLGRTGKTGKLDLRRGNRGEGGRS